MRKLFQPGIDVLLAQHNDWLAGRRVGLISHMAAVDTRGRTSAARLWQDPDVNLTALFAPEHGFFGKAGAGESCPTLRHPKWRIPIHSLYGKTRQPTPAMLRDIDVLVFDLQDLGVRCYTYVSTLRLTLEAAAAAGVEVVVADRPVPLPQTVEGPLLEKKFSSFVSLVETPLVYGMTPGETALWLQRTLRLKMTLRVAPMQGYSRRPDRGSDWPPWVPPSPSIRSWECATCYPATVCFEAFPGIDHGGRTGLAFQVLGAPWLDGWTVCDRLKDYELPGIRFSPVLYVPHEDRKPGRAIRGVRLRVTDPAEFQPVRSAVSLLHCLHHLYGRARLWNRGSCRSDFFDKLFGTDSVRKALLRGSDPKAIVRQWTKPLRRFAYSRDGILLY